MHHNTISQENKTSLEDECGRWENEGGSLTGSATALDSNQEKRMNYKNGTTLDTFGNSSERTLGSIESSRLAQAYLRLTDAYRLSDGPSPRNFAIDEKAKRIARALAVSVC